MMNRVRVIIRDSIKVEDAYGGFKDEFLIKNSFYGTINNKLNTEILDGKYIDMFTLLLRTREDINTTHNYTLIINNKEYKIKLKHQIGRVFYYFLKEL